MTAPPLTFTPEAAAEAERLARDEAAYRDKPLRVYIDGKGCDGFYYGVAFDERLPEDLAFPLGSLTVVVDTGSLPFLTGASVTWVNDERGRGFLVEHPDAKRFRGKFFKKKAWQEKLTKGASPASS